MSVCENRNHGFPVCSVVTKLESECDSLRAKLEISMQAVQFYAKQTSYSSSWVISNRDPIHAMEDKGRVANNALRAIESLEGNDDV